MKSILIVGRLSHDPASAAHIQVLLDNGRYAVERDIRHGETVLYINRNHRAGFAARWEYLDPMLLENQAAVCRITMHLAWEVARLQPRLQAVS